MKICPSEGEKLECLCYDLMGLVLIDFNFIFTLRQAWEISFYCYFSAAADGSKFVASPNLKREHESTRQ